MKRGRRFGKRARAAAELADIQHIVNEGRVTDIPGGKLLTVRSTITDEQAAQIAAEFTRRYREDHPDDVRSMPPHE